MTRAVLLPAGADPFLNAYWLRHYRTWADQVDELHIAVCGALPPEVIDYTQACVDSVPHATMHYFPERTKHGQVLTYLLGKTTADYVALVEDDAFVRYPAGIDSAFRTVESDQYDILAAPRDSYASESLIGVARRKFGDEPRGLAFWPCFLFAKLEHFEATDRVFDSTLWNAGDDFLGTTLTEPASADTFIWASYQLREMGLRPWLTDAHRLGDIPVCIDAPWFHVGSLSSGHGWGWMNDMTPERYAQEVEQWQGLPPGETAKRMAWWQRAWDHWDGGIPEYHEEYGRGMRQFMVDFGVDQREVDALRASYDYLVTWAES